MGFQIIRNDITQVKADAIVNTANPKPVIGGGTDKAIYDAAGSDKLLAARKKIGDINLGEAYETPAFDLDANFIIHTVGPVWDGGESGECEVLRSCYLNSLELATQYKCKSIAFPLISSGVYGFPKNVALDVAKTAIDDFLKKNEMEVFLVVFDDASLVASKECFKEIKEYVDAKYVAAKAKAERMLERETFRGNVRPDMYELQFLERKFREEHSIDEETFNRRRQEIIDSRKDIKGVLGGIQVTFRDRLLEFQDRKGMTNVDVYKGYFERKTYNKIVNDKEHKYHPSKGTAIQACLSLHLTLAESYQLLSAASYAFNEHFDPDIVIMYCILNQKWKIMDVNVELEKNGLPEFDCIY